MRKRIGRRARRLARRVLPRFNLGLRARIVLAFAIGALLISTVLAGITYGLTRENLLDERESSSRTVAVRNAQKVQSDLTPRVDPVTTLTEVQRPTGAKPVLRWDGGWYSLDSSFGRLALPDELRRAVLAGEPARMRFTHLDETHVAIGVPLPQAEAYYFEIIPLADVEDTLELLLISLVAAAIVTTVAGAGLGWWGARRVLQPLAGIRDAARDLAAGDLMASVEASNDRDLAPLAASFNNMVAALRERIERDARFASNVTHELRSPLMTLSASLEVLENNRADLPERAQVALDLLVADVNRFNQLLEDLLEMSRIDAGVAHVEREEVRIAELILYAVDEQTDQSISVDVAADLAGVMVEVDKKRLLRVVSNLLDNAAKYGGGASRVELSIVNDAVQVAVEDSGPGVPVKDRTRIFDRFSRGRVESDRTQHEGVGLGLSIVAEHVRVHGGDVWVEDRPDGESGARFVFTIPLQGRRTDRSADDGLDELRPPPAGAPPAAVPDHATLDKTGAARDALRA
jgi:two-component system, OmpR family, sensor histidine kinase MtrB